MKGENVRGAMGRDKMYRTHGAGNGVFLLKPP